MKELLIEKFVGRTEELAALDKEYRTPGFRMTILYGRRRIGKSTLLQKFIENKRAIFYTAIRSGTAKNTELLGRRVLEALAPESAELNCVIHRQLHNSGAIHAIPNCF